MAKRPGRHRKRPTVTSASPDTPRVAARKLPKSCTAGGLVVPLAALVESAQRELGRANAASQAAAWPAELTAFGWPAPTFVIDALQLSVPCLVRTRRRADPVLELVGGAAAHARCRRLVVSLTWSAQDGAALRAVRLDPSLAAPHSTGGEAE